MLSSATHLALLFYTRYKPPATPNQEHCMKAKWFLIGVIATTFIGDWLRLRVERSSLIGLATQSLEAAELRASIVSSCTESLANVKGMLTNVELRGQIAILSRAQSLNLFARARQGDTQAKELLQDLGLDSEPNTKLDPFERPISEPKLASRKK